MKYGPFFKTCLRYFVLLFFVFLLIPSSFYSTPVEGLDNSWNIAYHLAFKYHLVFGKDFLFTYGPLAILHSRYPIVVNLFVYLSFDIYFLATLFYVLKKVFARHFGWGTALFIFLVITVTMYETLVEWYFVFFLFFIFSFLKEPDRLLYLVQAIILAVICFFYKENLGTIAIFTFLATISYTLFRRKIGGKTYVLTLASFLAGIWLGSVVLHTDLKGYITGSIEIIKGYNEAQFFPLPGEYTKYLVAALLIMLTLIVWTAYRVVDSFRKGELMKNGDELFIELVLLANVFVLFKSGFLRADDSHLIVFFTGICFFTGFYYLYGPGRPTARKTALGCWLILATCFWALNTLPRNYSGFGEIVHFSLLPDKLAAVKNYLTGIAGYNDARAASDRLVTRENDLKKIIGDHSVDVIPSEISMVYFAGLRYNPRPVIQSYSAYNEYLDSLNAEKYRSSTAPDYVLYASKGIDDRYAFFDEPKTKRVILERYAIAGEWNGNLLLRKTVRDTGKEQGDRTDRIHWHDRADGADRANRANPADGGDPDHRSAPVHSDTLAIKFGETVTLRKTKNLQYARFRIDYSLAGKVRSMFYTPPLLKVEFTLENGQTRTFRGIKPILKEGVPVNKYVESTNDFQLLMRSGGLLAADVSKIRITNDDNPDDFSNRIRMIVETADPLPVDSAGLATFLGKYRPALIDSARLKKDSIRYWVENLKTYSEFIELDGWAFREEAGDINFTIKVLLLSPGRVYELPTVQQLRPDVEEHFHRTDPGATGFHAIVSKSQLEPGVYQLGIGLFPADGSEGRLSSTWSEKITIKR